MEFKPDKCEMGHFGKSIQDRAYTVNERALRNVDKKSN